MASIKIKNALISVFHKDGLDDIVKKLDELSIEIYSTGGTEKYIHNLGIKVNKVEDLTSYPSILGGRVKTLHPKIFGGILSRRDQENDQNQLSKYNIPEFDLVIVDLYPFEETVKKNKSEVDIIEKIDIGGISLIRAAAKNFKDVLIVSDINQYEKLFSILNDQRGQSNEDQRREFAKKAFDISSHYDTCIFNYFNTDTTSFKSSFRKEKKLRYGENPHQSGKFFGNLDEVFSQLNGKDISYNNLLDIDASINLISEFDETSFAILKHNNACGLSSDNELVNAWKNALAADPDSAFGGVLISNKEIDLETAEEIDKIFYEVLIAPSYNDQALKLLKKKKNRIILRQNKLTSSKYMFRSILNGILHQTSDLKTDSIDDMKVKTKNHPSQSQYSDLIFASKICKHTKSNTIVFVKNKQLLSSGVGQTSRVDAAKQAIEKAKKFGLDLKDGVMASDAFFPFPDCVKLAHQAGISSVIQPGGSIKDQLSIDYCNNNNISMVFTGIRHFKH